MSKNSTQVNTTMVHPVAERALAFFDELFPPEPVVSRSPTQSTDIGSGDFLDQIRDFSEFGTNTAMTEDEGVP
jgi:hypothetical protein